MSHWGDLLKNIKLKRSVLPPDRREGGEEEEQRNSDEAPHHQLHKDRGEDWTTQDGRTDRLALGSVDKNYALTSRLADSEITGQTELKTNNEDQY